jgi:hypothetical protein
MVVAAFMHVGHYKEAESFHWPQADGSKLGLMKEAIFHWQKANFCQLLADRNSSMKHTYLPMAPTKNNYLLSAQSS